MSWLTDNPIASMRGPEFLLFYGFLFVAVIAAAWSWRSGVEPAGEPPRIPENPDPFELAYLRGGSHEVARLAIFDLIQRGYLSIEKPKRGPGKISRAPDPPSPAQLSDAESALFNLVSAPMTPSEFFKLPLPQQMQELCMRLEVHLTSERLLFAPERRGAPIALRLCFFGLMLLGPYKLAAAVLTHHHNVGFLVAEWFVGGAVASPMLHQLSKRPRLTRIGKKYLARLRDALSSLRVQSKELAGRKTIIQSPSSAEPKDHVGAFDPLLLLVGLYGVQSLNGTAYAQVPQTFSSAASSSGCGSSCGSIGGSGCGGSSCGGGGCGGGGCGGCGS